MTEYTQLKLGKYPNDISQFQKNACVAQKNINGY